jgi:hypothetical protein
MSKEKTKHENKGATGATACNILKINTDLLHPCIFKEVATRVQQPATNPAKHTQKALNKMNNSILIKCCMLHPYFEVKF